VDNFIPPPPMTPCHVDKLWSPSYGVDKYDINLTWGFGSVKSITYLCIMVQSYTNHGRGGLCGHGRVYSDLPYIFFIRGLEMSKVCCTFVVL
jgi:hypothetical protein